MRIILNKINMNQLSQNQLILESTLQEVFLAVFKLYFKTHSYHWNIQSENFFSLHSLLEEQYTTLWNSLDDIAERFRVHELSAPKELPSVSALWLGSSSSQMIEDLFLGHKDIKEILRKAIWILAWIGDEAWADFLTWLLAQHEKMAWMLNSSLKV